MRLLGLRLCCPKGKTDGAKLWVTSCGLMLLLLSSAANAADILIAEMEDLSWGKNRTHADYVGRELRRVSF